jgi:UDP-N-acetyl-D-mannosaminuronate dehydrogenase
VAQIRVPAGTLRSVDLTPERVTGADCVVIATDHRAVDNRWIARHARRLVDTRNTIQDEIHPNSGPNNSSDLPEAQS